MNVKLLVQMLTAPVVNMIHTGIVNDDVVLAIDNEEIYNHIANPCKHWNGVVGICNGQDDNCCVSPYTPDNAQQRETTLLETIACLSKNPPRCPKVIFVIVWVKLVESYLATKLSINVSMYDCFCLLKPN
jgi:hypothetical protein